MTTDSRTAQLHISPVGGRQVRAGLLALLLPLLAGAGVAEWAVYRVFSRTFSSMPKTSLFQTIYHYGTQVGEITLYFAAIVAIATLVLLAARLGNTGAGVVGSVALRLAAIGMLFVLLFSAASLIVVADADIAFPVATALDAAIFATILALAAAYWQRNPAPARRILALALAATYATTFVANLSLSATALVLREYIGEGLVIADAALFFAAYALAPTRPHPPAPSRAVAHSEASPEDEGRGVRGSRGKGVESSSLTPLPLYSGARVGDRGRTPAIVATLAAVAFTGMALALGNIAQTAIVPILTNYSLGYTLHLPFPLYVAGLWLTVYTLVACFRSRERVAVALALSLIFAGGYQFYVSDQFMLAIAGLALLAAPEVLTERT